MCLIIHREAAAAPTRKGRKARKARLAHLSAEVVRWNKTANPDGFGIAWKEDGHLHHRKYGPKEFDAFLERLSAVDEAAFEYVAHFRTATHGRPCLELSHPFSYTEAGTGDEVLVFHNGVISIPTQADESDSAAFVRKCLAALPPRWWTNSGLRFLVEEAIGWSRLAIMTRETTVHLGSGWLKRDGIWYSTEPLPRTFATPRAAGLAGSGPGFTIPTPKPIPSGKWTHMGHPVNPVGDGAGDFGDCTCVLCGTEGDWYRLDGKLYVDVNHAWNTVNAD